MATLGGAPRPPPGYNCLPVTKTQILLPLTISNKCGQSFRWRGVEVYDEVVKSEEKVETEVPPGTIAVKKEDEEENEEDLSRLGLLHTSSSIEYTKSIEWSFCLSDRVVFVRQDEKRGYLYHKTLLPSIQGPVPADEAASSETAAWLVDYLNLRVPLAELYEEWSAKDEVFKRFAKRFTGVRMLRQDPWECLCAFICSSNNNIARIGQMVQNLCTNYSDPLLTYTYPPPPISSSTSLSSTSTSQEPISITYHPFPSPDRLAQDDVEAKLRELSFGYRSRYIAETARKLLDIAQGSEDDKDQKSERYTSVDDYLNSLRSKTYTEAREQLLQFPGVGPKVADCILLMSMDQPSSIPVDRHVFQFAERWYRIKTKGGLKGYEYIAEKFRCLWGEYAGWAHSVLFTADLRAFSTYKKEEEVKVEVTKGENVIMKNEYEQTILLTTHDANEDESREEEEEKTPIFYENGRPARSQQRRALEEKATTTKITEKFHGVKRGASQGRNSINGNHKQPRVEE